MITEKAQKLLSDQFIKRAFFFAGKIIPTGRTVSNNEYNVVLAMSFENHNDYAIYMSSARHMEFVRFVLHGWMLRGSQAINPEEEFIAHILGGTTKLEWERNPSIPDSEVVWGGEAVFDAWG